ncbi:DNA polymerase III subunit chi, partial [Gluconacetobacter johannae]
MAEIGFYHLTRSSLEQALPPLLGRTLDAGRRAVVRC